MLVRLLSADYGLLRSRLRGVRRATSRLKILKEPGVFADLHFWGRPSAEISQLLTGVTLESFVGARDRWQRLCAVAGILAFAEAFTTPFDSRSKDKLALTLECLGRLDGAKANNANEEGLVLAYKLRFLDLSGWRFSVNDTARFSLDAKMQNLCRAFEEGKWPAVEEEGFLRSVERAVDLYADALRDKVT